MIAISKLTLTFILLGLLITAGCSPGAGQNPDLALAGKLVDYDTTKYSDNEATGELIDGVRVIEIKAYQFFFTPELIVVNKGERVRLIISAEDGTHGFEIEGFNIPNYDIDTEIRPGIPLTVEFDADQVGVWEMICSIYCGFGHSTMKGTFVIR